MDSKNVKKSKHRILHNLALYSVFGFYILILTFFLFLKSNSLRSVNLVPFDSIMNYINGDRIARAFARSNLLGNIGLFMPLGIYLLLFNRNKNILLNTLFIILISAIVEVLQYIFMVGVTDIDDVILNGLGGFLGILLCKIILHFCKEKTRYVIELFVPVGGILGFLFISIS